MKSPKQCKNIEEIRIEIDRLDKEIISALAQRLEYVKEATKFKADIQAVMAPERHAEMMNRRLELAKELNLDSDLIENVYKVLLDYYKQKQLDIWSK
jgi:isochorismate pyruvate lyase